MKRLSSSPPDCAPAASAAAAVAAMGGGLAAIRVSMRELVDGGGNAEVGNMRVEQALVQWVRHDGRLLPRAIVPSLAAATIGDTKLGLTAATRVKLGLIATAIIGYMNRKTKPGSSGLQWRRRRRTTCGRLGEAGKCGRSGRAFGRQRD